MKKKTKIVAFLMGTRVVQLLVSKICLLVSLLVSYHFFTSKLLLLATKFQKLRVCLKTTKFEDHSFYRDSKSAK